MTAVRVAARVVLGAVLLLAVLATAAATAFIPDPWRLAWIVLVAAVTGCVTLAWLAFWPEGDSDG